MADAGVAADLDLAANVRGDLAAQVTFNLEIALDVVADVGVLRQVLAFLAVDARVRLDDDVAVIHLRWEPQA